jgi:hypothetical protein
MYLSACGQGPVAGNWEHGNESSGSIKGEEFLDKLSDYQLFIKDSVNVEVEWCASSAYVPGT